jgi:hypothetical protein
LNPILPKISDAEAVRFFNFVSRDGLRDQNKTDLIFLPSRPLTRFPDAFPELTQPNLNHNRNLAQGA